MASNSAQVQDVCNGVKWLPAGVQLLDHVVPVLVERRTGNCNTESGRVSKSETLRPRSIRIQFVSCGCGGVFARRQRFV
jgi:hypothetical protein